MNHKNKVGRPRAQKRGSDGPVEDEILAAARELFRTKGFSATSTREIASAAGLRQPTLFHYFKNKAAIMSAIAQRAMEPETQFLIKESASNHPPEVSLYRYVRFVVINLHTNPNVIGSPQKFPELTREEFGDFWRQYDQVRKAMRDYIKQGQDQGTFIAIDAKIASEQLFALMESSLTNSSRASATKVADTAATLVLRALLVEQNRLTEIQAQL